MTIDLTTFSFLNLLSLVLMIGTLIVTYFTWRDQRRHHRLIDVRMMFLDLWGSGTYEFIRTGKGWHAIGHRYDGDTIEVPWSGK